LDLLTSSFPKVNTDKKLYDFSEIYDELMSMKKTPTSVPFWTKASGGLFWEVIFALGRIDLLNVVKDDILDKTEIRENLSIKFGQLGKLTVLDIIVPNGKEGDKIVQLLTSEFYIKQSEISRFDLSDTLLESSINKKLTDSRYISTPEHNGISPATFYALGEHLASRYE
jgi:hypothetical protein